MRGKKRRRPILFFCPSIFLPLSKLKNRTRKDAVMNYLRSRRTSVFLTLLCFACAPVLAEDQPNFVVYLSDDHSQFDSSLYGNDNIPTPEFEKLAADGMTFSHAFVASPSCAPSRAAMLTGLMPARNGAEFVNTRRKQGPRGRLLPRCLDEAQQR